MKTPLRIITVLVLALSIGLFVLSILFRIGGFYINTTSSLPVGLYRIVDEPVSKGAHVAFCPPQSDVFDCAATRGYINQGDCPGGYGKLLKRVHAVAGDTVLIDETGITVNGLWLPNSAPLSTDAYGAVLPQYRLNAVLGESEYLLLSDLNPHSFDARYFGVIDRAQIVHVVHPIITFNLQEELLP
ncbi:MAG: conjugative transfer signal peptidase TraF [Nitrosomonas sp.]|jgi:conjugative transfer signal peptidase TraF|nr:conjugative transfer signal peptidase TraF [Nitrosomonas sp.]MCB1977144.1 conjugative transfer signal peptidase TraF [Nitrosomonas sp.]MCP5276648.1 conjugative transfer signal peptidase TraF [Burkholderiales bacterium]MDR4521606.1 conjugative transfer signal peptidase TraF [Nitrosomonas sp.]HQU62680.1 conjugative transfer signal peptidase TraF [Nitrosomonas sp.]